MEQAPKKIRIEVPVQQTPAPATPAAPKEMEIGPGIGTKCRPYELIKLNRADLVDKFSRRIGHTSKLTQKSMAQAYNQALLDAQYLLMAAEKDTQNLPTSTEGPAKV